MLTSNKQLEDSVAPALQVTSTLQCVPTPHWWSFQPGREEMDVAQEAGAGTEDGAQQLKSAFCSCGGHGSGSQRPCQSSHLPMN